MTLVLTSQINRVRIIVQILQQIRISSSMMGTDHFESVGCSHHLAFIDGFIDGFLLVNSPFPVSTVVNVLQRHFWFTVQTLVMTNVMQAWIVR